MKKIRNNISTIILLVLISISVIYAQGFQIKSDEPADGFDLPALKAPVVFEFAGIEWTNTMLGGVIVLATVILLGLSIFLFTKRYGVPTKLQIIMEMALDAFIDFIMKITGSEKLTQRILPIIGTVFIYIGLSNTITVLPGVEALEYNGVQMFRIHTSDFSTTFGIATAMVIWTQWFSIKQNNPIKHINKYIRVGSIINGFKKGIGEGLMSFIDFFVGFLDIIGEFAKIISLSARLFGNMFAGLMLNAILLAAIAVIAPAFLILYGLFSGIIQAIVFGALTASYFSMAVED